MDTPRGLQLSKDMLPVIQKFEPGQFIVFFLHPGVNPKVWEKYSAVLAQQVKGLDVGLFGMSDLGANKDVPTLPLDEERATIRDLRNTGARNGTIGILVYQFPKRFSVVELESDVSFHVFPGVMDSINIQLGKWRTADYSERLTSPQTINYKLPETRLGRIKFHYNPRDVITVDVRGGHRKGATWVSALIARMLRDVLDANKTDVVVIDSDGEFTSRYEASLPGTRDKSPYMVTASHVIIHDAAKSPRSLETNPEARIFKVEPPMLIYTKTTKIDGEICTTSVPKGQHDDVMQVPSKGLTEL